MKDALDLANEFYKQPNLPVGDVRPTKLIDFENIDSMFWVDIKLYESVNQSVWKLVFGQAHHRISLPNTDIVLYEGHCFYIKDLDVLANCWECTGCQQKFTCHDSYEASNQKQCTGSQLKLVCDGGKFRHIKNSSEIVFYGRNTQFLWKA